MFHDNDTVSSNTSAAEFKYFAGMDGYSNYLFHKLNSLCFLQRIMKYGSNPSVLRKFFESSWSYQNYMEEKYSNPFKVYNDSWTVDIISMSDGKLYHNLLKQLFLMSLLDIRHFLNEVYSIMKFEVQIIVDVMYRGILLILSLVFKAIFDNNLTESNSKKIHVANYNPMTMARMLK